MKKSGVSFAAEYSNLLKEWDYKDNLIQPDKVAPKSNMNVNWVCKYGHKWPATISNRPLIKVIVLSVVASISALKSISYVNFDQYLIILFGERNLKGANAIFYSRA